MGAVTLHIDGSYCNCTGSWNAKFMQPPMTSISPHVTAFNTMAYHKYQCVAGCAHIHCMGAGHILLVRTFKPHHCCKIMTTHDPSFSEVINAMACEKYCYGELRKQVWGHPELKHCGKHLS